MQKQLQDILDKYKNIGFNHKEDKDKFYQYINFVSKNLTSQESYNDFINILENSFLKYSNFDAKILYNPIELFDSIIENDLLGKNIDTDELDEILNNFNDFIDFYNEKLLLKDYIEKTYFIEIIFIKENGFALNHGIYANKLNNFQIINALNIIKKLIYKYPINFINNIKLSKIIIANYFYKEDNYGIKINLGGFETNGDNNIYLSFGNMVGSFDHELYHQAMQYYDDFDKWMEIRKNQKLNYLYSEVDKISPGFAREYGKENASEDQATIAEELMQNYQNIMTRTKNDNILDLKVQLVKKAFFELSDGIMDENYFEEKK